MSRRGTHLRLGGGGRAGGGACSPRDGGSGGSHRDAGRPSCRWAVEGLRPRWLCGPGGGGGGGGGGAPPEGLKESQVKEEEEEVELVGSYREFSYAI